MVYNFRIKLNQSTAAIPMVCQITPLASKSSRTRRYKSCFKNLQELGVKCQNNEVLKHSESSISSINRTRVESKT